MSPSSSANGTHRRPTRRFSPPPSPNGAEGRPTPSGPPSGAESTGRDARGRFAKGNTCSAGNPFARRLAAYRGALLSAVTKEEVEAIGRVLVKKALDGDVAAAKLLLSYAAGKPAAAPDPDGLDFGELRLYAQAIETTLSLPSVVNALPPDVACGLVQAVRPHIAAGTARQLLEGLTAPAAE
jgi:hypothetical protein